MGFLNLTAKRLLWKDVRACCLADVFRKIIFSFNSEFNRGIVIGRRQDFHEKKPAKLVMGSLMDFKIWPVFEFKDGLAHPVEIRSPK